mmetsp:Transcript_13683/g.39115  ORF Transcript_13683/g.39115 Transcript_13683/m.39115 type:complete len:314 (+) Transcript_13683:310-1251(+)
MHSMTTPGVVRPCRAIIMPVKGYCAPTASIHSPVLSAFTNSPAAVQHKKKWQICVNTSTRARKMNGRWFPRPIATFSQPQKWSNSSTQASVLVQYLVLGSLSTQVVVQSLLASTRAAFPREGVANDLSNSSTPDAPLGRGLTFPGSVHTVTTKSAIEQTTPSSKHNATLGYIVQHTCRMSVKYWKVAKETDTNQKVAGALCMNMFLQSSSCFESLCFDFRFNVRREVPVSTSLTTTPSSCGWMMSRFLRSCRRMMTSLFCSATSRTVLPWLSNCEGSTCFSSKNTMTPACEACAARCSGVILEWSKAEKLASK